MRMNLIELSQIAIKAARSAGKIIQQYSDADIAVQIKDGEHNYSSQVVTEVDKKSEEAILAHLIPTCQTYDIALLSEETEDDKSRFEKDYFWCIDPMDGTLAFINKHPGFSVSIALVSKEGSPVIGVVYDPTTKNLYHAIKGHGAYKNGKPWLFKNDNKHLSYLTDKKLIDTPHVEIIENLLATKIKELNLNGIIEIAGAGAVLNAILAVEKGPALMVKLPKKENGGGSIWDYAATTCIYNELGLHATSYNGQKLDLNKKESCYMNQEGVFFANF